MRQPRCADSPNIGGSRRNVNGAPTLVLAGGKDRVMPPHSSEVLASRIKGAKLVVIEGGAHALAAGPLNREVLGFLRGN